MLYGTLIGLSRGILEVETIAHMRIITCKGTLLVLKFRTRPLLLLDPPDMMMRETAALRHGGRVLS